MTSVATVSLAVSLAVSLRWRSAQNGIGHTTRNGRTVPFSVLVCVFICTSTSYVLSGTQQVGRAPAKPLPPQLPLRRHRCSATAATATACLVLQPQAAVTAAGITTQPNCYRWL